MPRLFTALEIPRDAALSLSLLRGGLPGARWMDVENYHMTLRFIGDIEGHVADEIAGALDRVRRPSFSLTLSGVGAFGSKKPHSVYAGTAASPDLNALQGEIDRICQRLDIAPGRVVLVVSSVNIDPAGVPIQANRTLFAADRVELVIGG